MIRLEGRRPEAVSGPLTIATVAALKGETGGLRWPRPTGSSTCRRLWPVDSAALALLLSWFARRPGRAALHRRCRRPWRPCAALYDVDAILPLAAGAPAGFNSPTLT